MKESYGEDLASHTDPESCTVAREGGREALTGACAGELLSREIINVRGADAVAASGRPHPMPRSGKRYWGPRAVVRTFACTETPHARTGRSRVCPSAMARRAALGSLRT